MKRIIPARAGFTFYVRDSRSSQKDHPRSRGVYSDLLLNQSGKRGSSPLARGLLIIERRAVPDRGIIPARAGFTVMMCRGTPRPLDHPRSRGVYWRRLARSICSAGSSPLARGLRGPESHRGGENRIIPARAGFTGCGSTPTRAGRDHPRSRGVYALKEAGYDPAEGSSPLARGLQAWTHTHYC